MSIKVFEDGAWKVIAGDAGTPARNPVEAKAPKRAAKRVVNGRWVVADEPAAPVEPEPRA